MGRSKVDLGELFAEALLAIGRKAAEGGEETDGTQRTRHRGPISASSGYRERAGEDEFDRSASIHASDAAGEHAYAGGYAHDKRDRKPSESGGGNVPEVGISDDWVEAFLTGDNYGASAGVKVPGASDADELIRKMRKLLGLTSDD